MPKLKAKSEFDPVYEPEVVEPEVVEDEPEATTAADDEPMQNTLIAEKVRRATAKKARPDFDKNPGYVYYASVHPEAYPFPITLGPGERVNGSWDTGRQHIVWRCPKELSARFERHDFYRNGRIVKID